MKLRLNEDHLDTQTSTMGELQRDRQKLLDLRLNDIEFIEQQNLTIHNYRIWFQKHSKKLIKHGFYKNPTDTVEQ
jgi:hypothetical protein